MTIEEIKMVHIVKLIPDMKLKEECAEILGKKDAKLEDIEKKVASYEMSKSMAVNIATVPAPARETLKTETDQQPQHIAIIATTVVTEPLTVNVPRI